MKKKIILFLFTFICFLLQSTVFKNITFGGVGPNLLIIVVASFGFMLGKKTGLILGFISGILIDLFFGTYIGFYALIYMLVGYWNGFFKRAFYPEDIKLPIILIIVSDFILEFLTYLFGFLMRGKIEVGYYFTKIFVPSLLYTMLIAFALYPIILCLNRYFEKLHRRSERKFGEESEE